LVNFLKASIIFVTILVIVAYLVMLGASSVRVSGSFAEDAVAHNIVWKFADEQLSEFTWLPERGVSKKEVLGFTDAIRNLTFIVSVTALTLLSIPVMIGLFIYAVVSGEGVGALLMLVFIPLGVIAIAIISIFMALALLFQPCTAAYALTYGIFIVPALLAGLGIGASPTVVIVIIKPV